jgi:hypothetical protein
MLKHFIFVVFLWFSCLTLGQQNDKYFEIEQKIQNLLDYKDKSPKQLRDLLTELQKYSKGNESSYEQVKLRIDNYLLPIEIKLARSEVYNKQFPIAISQLKSLKLNHPYRKEIENLEEYLDRKLFKFFKHDMLKTTPTIFSLEPSFSFFSYERNLKGFKKVANFNPVYGLGIYYKFNRIMKSTSTIKPRFSFSQIGLKMEYRDNTHTLMQEDLFLKTNGYISGQVSYLFRKVIGIDAGLIAYTNESITKRPFYTLTTSLFIPMGFVSIGINARGITDFTSSNAFLQFGATLKLNLGMYKPFSLRDREEVKSQIIKFKEH